jgi:hypothetical protein
MNTDTINNACTEIALKAIETAANNNNSAFKVTVYFDAKKGLNIGDSYKNDGEGTELISISTEYQFNDDELEYLDDANESVISLSEIIEKALIECLIENNEYESKRIADLIRNKDQQREVIEHCYRLAIDGVLIRKGGCSPSAKSQLTYVYAKKFGSKEERIFSEYTHSGGYFKPLSKLNADRLIVALLDQTIIENKEEVA